MKYLFIFVTLVSFIGCAQLERTPSSSYPYSDAYPDPYEREGIDQNGEPCIIVPNTNSFSVKFEDFKVTEYRLDKQVWEYSTDRDGNDLVVHDFENERLTKITYFGGINKPSAVKYETKGFKTQFKNELWTKQLFGFREKIKYSNTCYFQ